MMKWVNVLLSLCAGCTASGRASAPVALASATDSAVSLIDIKASLEPGDSLTVIPSYAAIQPGGTIRYRITAWVAGQDDESHTATTNALLLAMALKTHTSPAAVDRTLFGERVRGFLDDDETLHTVRASFPGGNEVSASTNFDGIATLSFTTPSQGAGSGGTQVKAGALLVNGVVTKSVLQLIPPRGISVVSDLDDTIKITEVTASNEMLRNTFFLPFRAVPGVVKVFNDWASVPSTAFHYVSMSPWQLYVPLSAFIKVAGFPPGSLNFKSKLFGALDLSSVFSESNSFKSDAIAQLIDDAPERHFVLLGDSGESDPEIYGNLARRYGSRIKAIFIRNVSGLSKGDARLVAAFKALPGGLWQLFETGSDLPVALTL